MADQDLTELVKKIEFDTESEVWDENPGNINEGFVPVPRSNAPRNTRESEDDL